MIPSVLEQRLHELDEVAKKSQVGEVEEHEYRRMRVELEDLIPGWYVYYIGRQSRHCIAPDYDIDGYLHDEDMV